MMEPWMTDDLVKDVSPDKLQYLSQIMERGRGNNPKERMQKILPLIKECKQKGIQFSSKEVAAVITAIKKYGSESENAQIDAVLKKVHFNG